ncbi:hypothetical protein B7R22_08700 [Subtercola boreus]|uniref:Bacterial bifunctional deaminase-reductase C-terminal domain-containing protein n=1 Tax=Subtercola boreus TaxID=120213 RepID=A0A3E0VXG5_9MICO|nr:pyrimidine reductase family protein [Subtercola boreus]RFA14784.1 hypothetical protein B7R22_08700 [Subtercola boreus]
MTDGILQLYPTAASPAALTDDQLLALYATPTRGERLVRANFVSSVDGSATASGLSGKLGGPADRRVFDLLRQLADVVLVGAGTVRSEGYGAMRLAPDAASWRVANGVPEHPVFALVSGRLDLDPSSDVFAKAPVRPLVLTVQSASATKRAALEEVADVVDCGSDSLDILTMLDVLTNRTLTWIHCEGGPSLLGSLVAADALDELCLTTSPVLEGGTGARIVHAATPVPLRGMRLDHLLLSGSMTLSKYSRVR